MCPRMLLPVTTEPKWKAEGVRGTSVRASASLRETIEGWRARRSEIGDRNPCCLRVSPALRPVSLHHRRCPRLWSLVVDGCCRRPPLQREFSWRVYHFHLLAATMTFSFPTYHALASWVSNQMVAMGSGGPASPPSAAACRASCAQACCCLPYLAGLRFFNGGSGVFCRYTSTESP